MDGVWVLREGRRKRHGHMAVMRVMDLFGRKRMSRSLWAMKGSRDLGKKIAVNLGSCVGEEGSSKNGGGHDAMS